MAKPGVMFYFDVRPCIKRLDINEKGRLFEAILDYGEFGIVPDLDGALGVAWDFIQPKLDRDAGRYDKQVEQKQYAVFSREVRKNGSNPVSFDEWKSLSDIERNRLLSADTERYPTTTSTPNLQPQTTSINLQQTTKRKADEPPTPAKRSFSQFGWVKLSQEEYDRLVADLGEAEAKRCIDYVDEAAQSTGNKNKWKDWNIVVRKCSRDGWGKRHTATNNRGPESGMDKLARLYKEEFEA